MDKFEDSLGLSHLTTSQRTLDDDVSLVVTVNGQPGARRPSTSRQDTPVEVYRRISLWALDVSVKRASTVPPRPNPVPPRPKQAPLEIHKSKENIKVQPKPQNPMKREVFLKQEGQEEPKARSADRQRREDTLDTGTSKPKAPAKPSIAWAKEQLKRALTVDDSYWRTLTTLEARSYLAGLQGAMDEDKLERRERRRFLCGIQRIVAIHDVLPPCFVLDDITREDEHPFDGGGFADIYMGRRNRARVCLKVVKMYQESTPHEQHQIKKAFYNEVLLWRQLKHPNLLSFFGVNEDLFPNRFCLVSPYMRNKNVNSFLKLRPGWNRLDMLCQVVRGLLYLHEWPVCHGDIRGANILVDDKYQCRLADFGITEVVESQSINLQNASSRQLQGCFRWMAPEFMSGEWKKPSTARDVYAFGCTILEIMTGHPPFKEYNNNAPVIFNVSMGKRPQHPQDTPEISDNLWKLIQVCWAQEPLDRPTVGYVRQALVKLLNA